MTAVAAAWWPGLLTPLRRRAIFHGLLIGGWVYLAVYFAQAAMSGYPGFDAFAYWSVDRAAPYGGTYGELGFFPYPPPAVFAAAPLALAPWPAFLVGWWALLGAALLWMGGRRAIVLLALPPVAMELVTGNIHILLAGAIVLSFRWPAAWAFVLLTKTSVGVGLVWFLVRREWRQLALAVSATAAIALPTLLLAPAMWSDWLAMLTATAGAGVGIPLWLRLPVAIVVIVWGAMTDRRWTVAVGGMLALPALWVEGLAMLVAVVPLRHATLRK